MVPLSTETKALLFLEFPPEERTVAEALLATECAENLPDGDSAGPHDLERIRRAVIQLSNGRLEQLRHWVTEAQSDPMAVLYTAQTAYVTQQELDKPQTPEHVLLQRVGVVTIVALILGIVARVNSFFWAAAFVFFAGLYSVKGLPPWKKPRD
ncbi:MAG: hypothetical protein AAF657_11270 [Acidobacteriota bacterium]